MTFTGLSPNSGHKMTQTSPQWNPRWTKTPLKQEAVVENWLYILNWQLLAPNPLFPNSGLCWDMALNVLELNRGCRQTIVRAWRRFAVGVFYFLLPPPGVLSWGEGGTPSSGGQCRVREHVETCWDVDSSIKGLLKWADRVATQSEFGWGYLNIMNM